MLEETAFECELPPLSVLFECDVLGLDVGVKCITDSDDVCLISDDVLDDGFRRGLCITYQGIGGSVRLSSSSSSLMS